MENYQYIWNWANFLFGGIGIFLGMAIFRFISNNIGGRVKINYPESGSKVPHEFECRGTRSWARWSNQELWIIVRPIKAGKFFPQGNMPAPGKKGAWRSLAYVGSHPGAELGDSFDVYAYTANAAASSELREYLFESRLNNSWKGLTKLPDGCFFKDQIEVVHG